MPLKSFNSEEILYYCVTLLIVAAFCTGFTRFFALSFADKKPSGQEAGFDFNPITNLDIVGTIVFFLGGFGWGRQLDDQEVRFKKNKLGWLLVSLIAPFASFTLALSAAYIKHFLWTDRVIEVVLHLCLAVTAYNILPIYPLAGARLVYLVMPSERVWRVFSKVGPYIILALVLGERFSGVPFLQETVAPVLDALTRFAEYH